MEAVGSAKALVQDLAERCHRLVKEPAAVHLLPRRRKCWYLCTKLHGVTFHRRQYLISHVKFLPVRCVRQETLNVLSVRLFVQKSA
jgi:hypothetical protein